MTTKSKANGQTAKPKKTAAPAKRTRTAAGQAGGIDLLRIADKVGLQQYAAEGFRDRQTRAMAMLARMDDGPTADQAMKEPFLMAQFIRERGGMSPEEVFVGIDSFAEEIAWEDRELNRLSAAIDAKYKEYWAKEGDEWPKEGEYWADGEAPEDMEILRTAWDDRLRQLKVSILRHHSENEMADILANDPGAYADRVEKGRKIFEDNHAAGKYAGKTKDEKAE